MRRGCFVNQKKQEIGKTNLRRNETEDTGPFEGVIGENPE
jgi:hypothetical protein